MRNLFSKAPFAASGESTLWAPAMGHGFEFIFPSPALVPPYDLEFSMADGVCRRYRGSVEFRDWRDEWEWVSGSVRYPGYGPTHFRQGGKLHAIYGSGL